MKTTTSLGFLLMTAMAAMGCGSDPQSEETALESSADSVAHATEMGALYLAQPRTETLSRTSANHHYTFASAEAGNVSGHVKLVMKSGTVKPNLRVTAPDGQVLSQNRYRNPDNGAWYAEVETDLRNGSYSILATGTSRVGEYTLSVDGTINCGGIAGFKCPADLKCLGVADHVDAMGTCAPATACQTYDDCGPSPLKCWGGYATCDQASKVGFGTCTYHCGAPPCDRRTTETCEVLGGCALQKSGCEGNQCQPDGEGGTVCNPCDPILTCVAVAGAL